MNRLDLGEELSGTVAKLSLANHLNDVTAIVAQAARRLAGADGATFVLRDKDQCYYADENAIGPLWKGKRFPSEICISGWCMTNKEAVAIVDIFKDNRIPVEAYSPTFVKSLCMVPIRAESPIGAIGTYWSKYYSPTPVEVSALKALADSASVALENLKLKQSIEELQRGVQVTKSFTCGPFYVDVLSQAVFRVKADNTRTLIDFTPIEAKLMVHFLQNEGTIFSRDELVKTLWGDAEATSSHTVHTHIWGIRRKIGDSAKHLKAVVRRGYVYKAS